ncbi:GtrA family protein [Halopseudomonas salegens]|uniref:GtrA-like protein n=1 Tax=Halopseudomonas salegens TaxID=1434072 RepID=A0A1H2HTS0_9GAMM|nr:GtrA family protein [Halopseudomonas salegens]SDU35189.1 GtrA-like protein [Halopseudomonas salegens]
MRRQLLFFFIIGGIQFVLDVLLFHLLVSSGIIAIGATVISRALAALLGFYLNGRYTFRYWSSGQPIRWPVIRPVLQRFAGLWCLQTLVSAGLIALAVIWVADAETWVQTLIKSIIELLIAVASFFLQRTLVYSRQ